MGLIWMQRVSVTAQGADGNAVVGQDPFELAEGCCIVEHGDFAVSVSGIISSGEFDRIDLECGELFQDRGQGKLRQQGSEDADSHGAFCLLANEPSFYRSFLNGTSSISHERAANRRYALSHAAELMVPLCL